MNDLASRWLRSFKDFDSLSGVDDGLYSVEPLATTGRDHAVGDPPACALVVRQYARRATAALALSYMLIRGPRVDHGSAELALRWL